MQTDKRTSIVTTFPLSDKHRISIEREVPSANLSVYESVEEARQALPEAEILVTYGEDLTAEYINECKRLKWIQVISAGVDKMPFEQIAHKGILVTNARGIHAVPMAEYVVGALLQITHRAWQFYDLQQKREWDRSVRTEELHGKTLGILGPGAIGSAVAEKAKAFGMRVIGMNTKGTPVPHVDEMRPRAGMDSLLQESDFIVVIVPLTDATRDLVGGRELRLMKKDAWLINISRGDVVEESALNQALQEHRIGGAVLDVFRTEPLPQDSPLWTAPNCIVTPHISGRSPRYMERAMEIFVSNLKTYVSGSGDYINQIDPAIGY